MEEKIGNQTISDGFNITDFKISTKDRELLRRLAARYKEIAVMPVQNKTKKLWSELNSLKKTRPLIGFSDLPWHEMDFDEELKTTAKTPFARYLESRLRREIYQFAHMAADMVVEPVLKCYKIIEDTGFGIEDDIEVALTDELNNIISRDFKPQFRTDADIEKIREPKISYDRKNSMLMYEAMQDIFSGILDVKLMGTRANAFPMWDKLVRWYGVEEALTDLALKPRYIHRIMDMFTEFSLKLLGRYEEEGLLMLNNGNYRIGSGGLGYTEELPGPRYDPAHIRSRDMWGFATSQIFCNVSPAMHDEFALAYEIKWLERFGLNYYGCCEPLDIKMDIVRKIPNLRKVSMSPWVDLDRAAEAVGTDYVFSYKPSPSVFVAGNWEPARIKEKLRKDLAVIKGCHIEIIMKDISTIKYEPKRLWDWARIAMEVAEE